MYVGGGGGGQSLGYTDSRGLKYEMSLSHGQQLEVCAAGLSETLPHYYYRPHSHFWVDVILATPT